MKLLQNNVLGGNKLNCFKATQVLGGPTHILIWASEILFYDEVIVEKKFYAILCFFKKLCSLKFFHWSSCFLWFFCCSVSFYSCPICLLVTPKFFLIHLDSCLLYVFCPFPLLYSAFLHFLLTLTCIFSFFLLELMAFLLWYFIYKPKRRYKKWIIWSLLLKLIIFSLFFKSFFA